MMPLVSSAPEPSPASPLREFLESISLVDDISLLCVVTDNAKAHAYNDTITLHCLLHASASDRHHSNQHNDHWGHSSILSNSSSSSSTTTARWGDSLVQVPERLPSIEGGIDNLPDDYLHIPERLPSLEGLDRFTIDEYPKKGGKNNKEGGGRGRGGGDDSLTSIIPHRLPSIDALEEITSLRRGGGMMMDEEMILKAAKWLVDDDEENIIESSTSTSDGHCGMVKMPQRLDRKSVV